MSTLVTVTNPRTGARRSYWEPGLGMICLTALAGFGILRTHGQLPFNIAFVDAILVVLMLIGLRLLRSGVTVPGHRALGRWLMVLAWVYVIGQILGATAEQFRLSAFVPLVIDLYPVTLAYLLVPILASSRSLRTAVLVGLIAAYLAASLSLIGTSGERSSAFFPTPNFGAHVLVTLGYLGLHTKRRSLRLASLVITPLGVAALIATGSFGGVLSVAVLVAYDLSRVRARLGGALRFMAAVGIVAAVLIGGLFSWKEINKAEFSVGAGLNDARLERSEESRLYMYGQGFDLIAERPIGHGTSVEVEINPGVTQPVHNDPLSFALEGGILGFIAFVGTYSMWFRVLPKHSAARAILLMSVVSGFFRETFNFRHTWLAIAVLWAVELYDQSPGRVARQASPDAWSPAPSPSRASPPVSTPASAPGRTPMTDAGTPPAIE